MKNVLQKLFKTKRNATNTPDDQRAKFVKFVSDMPFNDYRPIRSDIIKATGVSRATFSMWCKNGVPRKSDREQINNILERHGYKKLW